MLSVLLLVNVACVLSMELDLLHGATGSNEQHHSSHISYAGKQADEALGCSTAC